MRCILAAPALLCASYLVSAVAASPEEDPILRLPLKRMAKTVKSKLPIRVPGKKQPPTAEIHEFWKGYTYTIEVGLGHPVQNTTVVFDSGSDELWVNPTCANIDSNVTIKACEEIDLYYPGNSSTSQDLHEGWQIAYGSGSASGDYYLDNAHIAGAKLKQIQFGVNNASYDMEHGILGTGFGKGYTLNYSNVMDEMADQKIIKQKQFSITLREPDEEAGEVVFGGVDVKKFAGKLHSLPILPPMFEDGEQRYLVSLTSFGISTDANDSSSCCTSTVLTASNYSYPVLLDTGTSVAFLPSEIAEALVPAFPGALWDDVLEAYSVDCGLNSTNTLDFGFGDFVIKLPVRSLLYKIPPSNDQAEQCVIGVLGSDDFLTPFGVLGDTFLKSVLTVFSQDDMQIYIAPLEDCGSEIQAVHHVNDTQELEGKCKAQKTRTCGTTTTKTSTPTTASLTASAVLSTETTSGWTSVSFSKWYAPSCTFDSCLGAMETHFPDSLDFCTEFVPLRLPTAATMAINSNYTSACAPTTPAPTAALGSLSASGKQAVDAVTSACICLMNSAAAAQPSSQCRDDSCLLLFYNVLYPEQDAYESDWCSEWLATSTSVTDPAWLPYGYWCTGTDDPVVSISSACSCFLGHSAFPTETPPPTTAVNWNATLSTGTGSGLSTPTASPAGTGPTGVSVTVTATAPLNSTATGISTANSTISKTRTKTKTKTRSTSISTSKSSTNTTLTVIPPSTATPATTSSPSSSSSSLSILATLDPITTLTTLPFGPDSCANGCICSHSMSCPARGFTTTLDHANVVDRSIFNFQFRGRRWDRDHGDEAHQRQRGSPSHSPSLAASASAAAFVNITSGSVEVSSPVSATASGTASGTGGGSRCTDWIYCTPVWESTSSFTTTTGEESASFSAWDTTSATATGTTVEALPIFRL